LKGGSQIRSKADTKRLVTLYPNPSNGEVVTISIDSFDLSTGYKYSVYNLLGESVFSGKINAKETVLSNSLNAGVYIVSISNNKEIIENIKWIKTQ
jgi:hypothetical protein